MLRDECLDSAVMVLEIGKQLPVAGLGLAGSLYNGDVRAVFAPMSLARADQQ